MVQERQTIRNLLGFVNATKGSATIAGLDCRKDAKQLQNVIGYLPGEMALFEHMSGMEFIVFMNNMRKTKDLKKRDGLIERFELDTQDKIKKMSKGMKQKIGIITAFMHDPDVYILDEPTSGLDPLMQSIFMELIEEEKKKGKTILMSSHIFEEIHRSCDRAGIIREGRIVAVEDVKSLGGMKAKTYTISLGSKNDVQTLVNSRFNAKLLSDMKVQISANYPYKEFFGLLSKCDVKALELKEQSLEDVFMKYYGEAGDLHE